MTKKPPMTPGRGPNSKEPQQKAPANQIEFEAIPDEMQIKSAKPRGVSGPPAKVGILPPDQSDQDLELPAGFATQTLAEAKEAFFAHLKDGRSHKEATLRTYLKDWALFESFFTPDKKLANFMPVDITNFLKSDIFLKKPNGVLRASPTTGKTARLLKMFLKWCEATGRMKQAPIPKNARMGGRSLQDVEDAAKAREKKKVEMALHKKREKEAAQKR